MWKLLALLLWLPGAAMAQPAPAQPVAPPPESAVPVANPAAPAPGVPPKIRYCRTQDIQGFWKLVEVFENPPGAITQRFQETPHQYLHFADSGLRYEIAGKAAFSDASQLNKAVQRAQRNVLQYVGNDKGVLYFYTNEQPTASYYCGMAENTAGPYMQGDMVFTPTEHQGSLFMVYRRPVFGAAQPSAPVGWPAPGDNSWMNNR